MPDIRIRCPKCNWEPDGHKYWQCSCGFVWNTFETGGTCPECGKIWSDTQCVEKSFGGCEVWSAHIDWYEGLDMLVNIQESSQ